MPIRNTSREINSFRLQTYKSMEKTFKVWSETYKKTQETFNSLKCLTNLMHGELNEDTFSSYIKSEDDLKLDNAVTRKIYFSLIQQKVLSNKTLQIVIRTKMLRFMVSKEKEQM